MTTDNNRSDDQTARILPEPGSLLHDTDWAALEHARGTAEDVPAALAALLDPNPAVQAEALDRGLEPLRHQGSIYPATASAALYIAAILPDPRTTGVGIYDLLESHIRQQRPRPLRAALLDWLGFLAYDSDDQNAEIGRQRGWADTSLHAVRALRPVLFHAVSAFLHDADPEVRAAALVAAIPLVEAPELTRHRTELVPCARQILAASTDRYYRDCAIDGLTAWGHDVRDLLTPDDPARLTPPDPFAGGSTDDPLF